MADNNSPFKHILPSLFPRYFLENMSQDGTALFELIAGEIDKLLDKIEHFTEIIDPDLAPAELLDYLASLMGVPFLPAASQVEKIQYIKSELVTCPLSTVYEIADIYGVDINMYATPDEKRLVVIVATDTATDEQIDQALYVLGASYKLGIMTTEQKRLAIKQAISWYRVKGRERAYQILLRVYGLQAEILPLWTENYESFWEDPQGVIIEDGGSWYITPHYAINILKYSEEGALSASVLSQFIELVRNEVQPAHCVLQRVSFTQYFVDYVEITEESVFDIDYPIVDVIGWPECTWQNRGREQVLVPLRNGMVQMTRLAVPTVPIDYIMVNYNRGVDLWNGMFLPEKFRDNNFIQGWDYISFYFNREDPRAPTSIFHYPALDRSDGFYSRDGVFLYAPQEVVDAVEETYAEFYWLRGGAMFDYDWVPIDLNLFEPGAMFPRDPYYCDAHFDPFDISEEATFEDKHSIVYPREMCTTMKRNGSFPALRDGSAEVSIDECLGLDITPLVDTINFEDDNTLDLDLLSIADYMCPDVQYRDGSATIVRNPEYLYRAMGVLYRDGSREDTHDGLGNITRNHGGIPRDGTYTRDVVYQGVVPYRRDQYCYTDDLDFVYELVDSVVPVDTLLDSIFEYTLSDQHDLVEETDDALEFGYETHEHFCNTMFREYGVCCGTFQIYEGDCVVLRDGSCEYDRTSTEFRNRECAEVPCYHDEKLCRGSTAPIRGYNWEEHAPMRGCHDEDFIRDGSFNRDYIDSLNYQRDGSVVVLRDAHILDDGYWRRDEGRCVEDTFEDRAVETDFEDQFKYTCDIRRLTEIIRDGTNDIFYRTGEAYCEVPEDQLEIDIVNYCDTGQYTFLLLDGSYNFYFLTMAECFDNGSSGSSSS